MDSSIWSDQRKVEAGKRFANRLKELHQDPVFRALSRRDKLATDLSIALTESGRTLQFVADTAGIKLSQLSRQLAGETNLTFDAIGKICEAIGYDFDLVLHKPQEKPAMQPWKMARVFQEPAPAEGAAQAKAPQRRASRARG
jgi:DNA-binding phage protein